MIENSERLISLMNVICEDPLINYSSYNSNVPGPRELLRGCWFMSGSSTKWLGFGYESWPSAFLKCTDGLPGNMHPRCNFAEIDPAIIENVGARPPNAPDIARRSFGDKVTHNLWVPYSVRAAICEWGEAPALPRLCKVARASCRPACGGTTLPRPLHLL